MVTMSVFGNTAISITATATTAAIEKFTGTVLVNSACVFVRTIAVIAETAKCFHSDGSLLFK
jgi:hypothetical protein